MDQLQSHMEQSSIEESYISYKTNKLFVKFFKPLNLNKSLSTCLFIVHWMDNRGHIGNNLYKQLGEFYSSHYGIPVFLYDILGSGRSRGTFEFPKDQKDQVSTVYRHIVDRLNNDYASDDWVIIPIAHSISIIAVLSAVNEELSFSKLIWLGGPPSHTKSFNRAIRSQGRIQWFTYLTLSRLDTYSGIVGLKFRKNVFGFNLRLKDIRKYFKNAHGAKMILDHPEIQSLVIFGAADEYMRQTDIREEFGEETNIGQLEHIKIVVLQGANHGFRGMTNELIKILNPFISKVDNDDFNQRPRV